MYPQLFTQNILFYSDNLNILREYITETRSQGLLS